MHLHVGTPQGVLSHSWVRKITESRKCFQQSAMKFQTMSIQVSHFLSFIHLVYKSSEQRCRNKIKINLTNMIN